LPATQHAQSNGCAGRYKGGASEPRTPKAADAQATPFCYMLLRVLGDLMLPDSSFRGPG